MTLLNRFAKDFSTIKLKRLLSFFFFGGRKSSWWTSAYTLFSLMVAMKVVVVVVGGAVIGGSDGAGYRCGGDSSGSGRPLIEGGRQGQ